MVTENYVNEIAFFVAGLVIGMLLYPKIMRWAYSNAYIPSLPDMVSLKREPVKKDGQGEH